MDEEYDVIILGTGLIECVLSGMLSVSGRKVLHIDRNPYYGNESTSFSLDELYKYFNRGPPPENLGRSRDYCVDTLLKLILARGELVDILLALRVNKYLNFQQLGGSFVYRDKKLYKVPVNQSEVLKTFLIGIMQKKSLYNFLSDLNNCDVDNLQVPSGLTPNSSMLAVYEKYGLNEDNRELVGHVIAAHQNDDYLNRPCMETFKRIRAYKISLECYGQSPYLYPNYGMGELSQAFARLAAVFGGVYMLNTNSEGVEIDSNGKVCGVKINGTLVKTKLVIADPSYFPDRVHATNKKVRCICLLDHPVHLIAPCQSAQIIIPARQVKRKSDIYVSVISPDLNTSPVGKYIGIVSTLHECADPYEDVKVGVELLSPVLDKFLWASDIFEPNDDGTNSNIYLSSSYDASTLYEPTVKQIKDIWKRITGSDVDINYFKEKTKQPYDEE